MRTGLCFWACTLLVTLSAAWDLPPASDSDRDGIADEREQALLEKFRPTFLISVADCDFLPAEFLAGSEKPRAVARNGTIYGQVFPRSSGPEKGALIEIHYYHLWARDCGRTGHALDAEHVAVLVSGEDFQPVSTWTAVYWYAAAHENTLCDRSAAVKALAIRAEDRARWCGFLKPSTRPFSTRLAATRDAVRIAAEKRSRSVRQQSSTSASRERPSTERYGRVRATGLSRKRCGRLFRMTCWRNLRTLRAKCR